MADTNIPGNEMTAPAPGGDYIDTDAIDEEATCVVEMNDSVACLQRNEDSCACFDFPRFRENFPKELRKQFYSAQAWLPATDLAFCEVANQRVCQHNEVMQSCCCTEATTRYKDCYINNVLIYELPIPGGCQATCESTLELSPTVTGADGEVVTVVYKNGNNTLFVAIVGALLGLLVIGGSIGGYFMCRHYQQKKQKEDPRNKGASDGYPTIARTSLEESYTGHEYPDYVERGVMSMDDDGEKSTSDESYDNSTIRTKELSHPQAFSDSLTNSPIQAVDITPSVHLAKEKRTSATTHPQLIPTIQEEEVSADGPNFLGFQCKPPTKDCLPLVNLASRQKLSSFLIIPLTAASFQGTSTWTGSYKRTIEEVKKDRENTNQILSRLQATREDLQKLIEKSKAEAKSLSCQDPMSEWSRNEIAKEIKEIKLKLKQLDQAKTYYEGHLDLIKGELKLLRQESVNEQIQALSPSMEGSSKSRFKSHHKSSPAASPTPRKPLKASSTGSAETAPMSTPSPKTMKHKSSRKGSRNYSSTPGSETLV